MLRLNNSDCVEQLKEYPRSCIRAGLLYKSGNEASSD